MNTIKIVISICAGIVFTSFRYKIGSSRYTYLQLFSELEDNKSQALNKFFERFKYSLAIILYPSLFFFISVVANYTQDARFILVLILWMIFINAVYFFYYTFYNIEKQVALGIGENIIPNFILPLLFKNFNGLNVHRSNCFEIAFWIIIMFVLYVNQMYISCYMISTSIISFGIVAFNYYLIETENIRSLIVGKKRDEALNNPYSENKPLDNPSETIIISKP